MTTKLNFDNLSIEQKIGQLFFIGLPGTEIDEQTRRLLEEISPGGVCLFTRNIRNAEQTRKLLDDLREILPVEPFLSLDQEGGLVDRLRRVLTPMPSAKAVSQNGNPAFTKKLARITAEAVRTLGFNMNFAPVVDVIDEEREKFTNGLYSRNFGKTKEDVVEFSSLYLKTLQEGGCMGCIKHFPGYGASEVDSHEELPKVNLSREALLETDLFPYSRLFENEEVYSVMIGHAAYPPLDLQEKDSTGEFLPSSLSRNIITKLLREDFGFDNLVLTDDLEMGAILKNYGIGDASVMAFNAGNDSILICANPDAMTEAFRAVKKAVETSEISEARLNESLERIARIKNLLKPALPFDESRLQLLSEEIKQLNEDVS